MSGWSQWLLSTLETETGTGKKMISITNTEVYGFGHAFRAMRNPMDSWAKSDSSFWGEGYRTEPPPWSPEVRAVEKPLIGPNDLSLLTRLIRGGTEHRKVLRTIQVWCTIAVARYHWCEIDTYKIGTVRNSCSTMHKLGSRDLTPDDFAVPIPAYYLDDINDRGRNYRLTKDYAMVREMKGMLPEGYIQRADYCLNYEVCLRMHHQRQNHRLPEWSAEDVSICKWIEGLPYMVKILIAAEERR